MNKRNYLFIIFNIETFYQSVSLYLFNDTMESAMEMGSISDGNMSVIMQARKILLFNILGLQDGAEIYELVGTHLSNQLKEYHS